MGSLLWTDFIMCQVNLDDHNLFSAVSYIQLLLCMPFISSYCLIRLFNSFMKATKGTFLYPWAELAMGRVCNGPRLLWAEFVTHRVQLAILVNFPNAVFNAKWFYNHLKFLVD